MRTFHLSRIGAAIVVASAALFGACGDSTSEPKVVIRPFDNIAQANITTNLRLFGGGGQWTIDLTAVVHNTTSEPRLYKVHSTCPVALLVYNNSAGTGTPAWDSRFAMFGCKSGEMVADTIAPGDSIVLHGPHTNTNEILAHYGTPPANPPGQYFFFFSVPTDLTAAGELLDFAGFSQLSP
jgi:hypothetical protein